MKVLVCILTTRYALRAMRAFYCLTRAQTQMPQGYSIEIKIVVNSLDPNYADEIRNLGLDCDVIETTCNGTAAGGKNSVFDYFLGQTDADYCWQIDGDDLVYPWAVAHMNTLMHGGFQFDAVTLPTHDHLVVAWDDPNVVRVFDDRQYNIAIHTWTWTSCPILDFRPDQLVAENSGALVTPDRIWLLSRKAAELTRFCQELEVYEDFDLSMQLYYLHHENMLKYFTTGCNGIYLWDSLREESVCRLATKEAGWHESTKRMLNHALDNKVYQEYGRCWNSIPRIMLPNCGWNIENKREFVRQAWYVPDETEDLSPRNSSVCADDENPSQGLSSLQAKKSA